MAEDEEERWARHYRERFGVEPPWLRVWKDGRDVTDEPPETWPYPWNPNKRPGER